jgi:hypothetical protein
MMMTRIEVTATIILSCESYVSGEEDIGDVIIGSEIALNSLPPVEVCVAERDKHKIHARFHFRAGSINEALGHKIEEKIGADQSDLKEEIVMA